MEVESEAEREAADDRAEPPTETDGIVGDWIAEDSRVEVLDGGNSYGRRDRVPTRQFWPSVLAGVVVTASLARYGFPSGAFAVVAAPFVAGIVRAGGIDRGGIAGAVAAPLALAVGLGLTEGWFFLQGPMSLLLAVGAVVVGIVAAAVGAVCGGVGGALGATEPLAPDGD